MRLPQHEFQLHMGGLAFDKKGEIEHSRYWGAERIRAFLSSYKRPGDTRCYEPYTLTNLVGMANQMWDQRTREGANAAKINLACPPLAYTRLGKEIPGNENESNSFQNTVKNNPRAIMEVLHKFCYSRVILYCSYKVINSHLKCIKLYYKN